MKQCFFCDKKLTFRDSFTWNGLPICKVCLKQKIDARDQVNIKKQQTRFSIRSWGFSLITAFTSLILAIFLFHSLDSIIRDENISSAIAYSIYNLIIIIACFFICRKNPKSVWYVPFLCNTMGIISALVEPNFWITNLWIAICSGWVLSIIASIIGVRTGNKLELIKSKFNKKEL